jgi:hypothetical protein
MGRKQNNLGMIAAMAIIIGLIYGLSASGAFALIGVPDISNTLATLLPGLIVLGFSLFGLSRTMNSAGIIGVMTIAGIGLALLTGELVTANILLVSTFGGYSLAVIQDLTVVVALIFGVVVYAVNN